MYVGDDITIYTGLIPLGHSGLSHGIVDLIASLVLIQASEGGLPLVRIVQRNGLARILVICIKLNGDRIGAQTVLVVVILPDLFHVYIYRVNLMGVGHRQPIGRAAAVGNAIVRRDAHLFYGICMGDAAGFGDQSFPDVAPVIARSNRDRGAVRHAILFQLQRHALGADPVLIVLIRPDLVSGYLGARERPLYSRHREGVRFIFHRQIGFPVGGVVLSLHKALALYVQFDAIGVCIGIGSGAAIGGGRRIRQAPGVGPIAIGYEGVRCAGDHANELPHRVGSL